MTDCVYFLLSLALGKLSLMLLINYQVYQVYYIGKKCIKQSLKIFHAYRKQHFR